MKRVLFLTSCFLSTALLNATLVASESSFKDLSQMDRFISGCGCGGGGGGGQNQEIPPDKKQ